MRGRLISLLQIPVLSIVGFLVLLVAVSVDGRFLFPSPDRTVNAVAVANLITATKTEQPKLTATDTPRPTRTMIPATIATSTVVIVPNASRTAQPSSPLLRVGGTIWNDSNRDGIRGSTEQGIQDIFVDLYASKFHWIAGTESDANGDYFIDAPPGKYVVVIEVPSGYISTVDSEDTYHPERWIDDQDNGLGTNGEVIPSHPIPLQSASAGEHTIDFGLQEAATKENQFD